MKKIILLLLCLFFMVSISGCQNISYGYKFHYYVDEGEGRIVFPHPFNPIVTRCKDAGPMCELSCPSNSYLISLSGGKYGNPSVTFIAVPEEGYRVKEWLFNGEIIVGNNTDIYTAVVTRDTNYNGVIAIRFEKI